MLCEWSAMLVILVYAYFFLPMFTKKYSMFACRNQNAAKMVYNPVRRNRHWTCGTRRNRTSSEWLWSNAYQGRDQTIIIGQISGTSEWWSLKMPPIWNSTYLCLVSCEMFIKLVNEHQFIMFFNMEKKERKKNKEIPVRLSAGVNFQSQVQLYSVDDVSISEEIIVERRILRGDRILYIFLFKFFFHKSKFLIKTFLFIKEVEGSIEQSCISVVWLFKITRKRCYETIVGI